VSKVGKTIDKHFVPDYDSTTREEVRKIRLKLLVARYWSGRRNFGVRQRFIISDCSKVGSRQSGAYQLSRDREFVSH
jgi:hypothetical protein